MASRGRFSLPLFTKELLEQAARRRTYLIRVIYVGLLSYAVLTTLALQLRSATSPMAVLGQGLPILKSLVEFEFNGIFLFLPAMACGVFTSEKERNTLALLFLTRLGPWTIIIEKLLSRLFPMLMFLFCALPVMAFLYSLGGLTLFQLLVSGYYLLLALFLTGCVAVMCSALTHSTASAFVQTYVALLLIGVAPQLVLAFIPAEMLYVYLESLLSGSQNPAIRISVLYEYGIHPDTLQFVLSPYRLWTAFLDPWGGAFVTITPWIPAVLFGIPSFLAGLVCLLVARWALYRRAFVAPSNPLLKFFRGLDKIFFWANRKMAFDVKLVREADSLPGDEPIAWREVSKRSLGQFRYLVRIMIPLLFPVIFAGAMIVVMEARDWRGNGNLGLSPLVLFLWIVQLLLIAVTGANSIPLERMRQTWDVLRSLPLTGRDILLQKLRGVRRLQWVCAIPVLASIGLQAWLRFQLDMAGQPDGRGGLIVMDQRTMWWEYLVGAVAAVWVYSELVKWVALWCGLMFRNSMRAILAVVPAVGLVCILPSLLLLLIARYCRLATEHLFDAEFTAAIATLIATTCPVVFVALNEFAVLEMWNLRQAVQVPLLPALINFAWQGALLFLLRWHMLRRSEWYLGRIGVPVTHRPPRQLASATPLVPQSEDTAHVVGAAS